MGFSATEVSVVRDDKEAISDALKRFASRYDIVICTGGLGPTRDDVTRFAAADFLKSRGYYSKTALKWLREYLSSGYGPVINTQKVQAWVPRGSRLLRNNHGTACGFRVKKDSTAIYFLPGVPLELNEMLREHLAPLLVGKKQSFSKSIWLWGLSESKLQEYLGFADLPAGAKLSILASVKGIRLCFSASIPGKSGKLQKGQKRVLGLFWKDLISKIPGEYIINPNGLDPAETLLLELKKSGSVISAAESCSGGALGFLLTSVAGSSEVFHQGLITYSNEVKTKLLGVSASRLDKSGAVSEEVVRDMVSGAVKSSGSDYACAISGIAGPGGGTDKKPVGTVWIAAGSARSKYTKKLTLSGNRDQIRWKSAYAALNLMIAFLKDRNLKKHLHK